jgi:hypothetical protein
MVGIKEQRLDDLLPLLKQAGFDADGSTLAGTRAARSLNKGQAITQAALGYPYGAMKVFTGGTLATPVEVQSKTVNPETRAAQWERDDEHELNELLQFVNSMMTWPGLMSLTSGYVFAVGSAYWLKVLEAGRVTALWPLPPQDMKPIINDRELLYWEQTLPKTQQKLRWQPEEIVRFIDPIPGQPAGWGRLQAAAGGVKLLAEIVNAQFSTMVNGGLPSLFVWLQEPNHKKRMEYFRSIEAKLKGSSQAGQMIGLRGPKGDFAEVETINKTTAHEMGFDTSTNNARDMLLGATGTSKVLVGLAENINRATVEGAEMIYSKYQIAPWLMMFDAQVTQDLVLPHWGPDIRIQHDSPVPRNRELDLKEAETRFKLGDTWNAIAAERGWPSHEWGNKWYASAGLLPIDEDGPPADDREQEQQMFVAQLEESAVRLGMSAIETRRMIATAKCAAPWKGNGNGTQHRITAALVKPEVSIAIPAIQAPRGFNKARRRRLERAAWRLRTPLRLGMRDAVAKYFADVQNRVLDAFDSAFPNATQGLRKLQTDEEARELNNIIDVAMDPEATAEELAKRTQPFTARGIVLGGNASRVIFDASLPEFKFDSRAAQKYAAEWSDAYWPELTRRQQREVKQTILRGIEKQVGLGEIRNDIEQQFTRWQELPRGRAMAIATTETTKLYNAGGQAFMEENEVPFKQWATSFVRSRDAHISVDGQPQPVNQPFKVGGEKLMYPGIGSIPGNNINCHCISVPVPR